MKRLVAVCVMLAGCFCVQSADACEKASVRRAPVRKAVSFFRTNKPMRKLVKAVVTYPVKRVKARRGN